MCGKRSFIPDWTNLHQRNVGKEIDHDVTAFVETHKDWSKERRNGRPNTVFQPCCMDGRKGHKRPTKFVVLKASKDVSF